MERIKNITLFDIIIFFSTIDGVNNLKKGIFQGKPFSYYMLNVLLFLIISLITIFSKKRKLFKWNASIFLVIGIITTLLSETNGNVSGAGFLMISLYIYNSDKSNIVLCALLIISILLRSVLFDFAIPESFNLLLGYAFLISAYYVVIHPKKPEILQNPNIKPEERETIQYLAAGYQYKEIEALGNIDITAAAMRQQMKRVKKKFNCSTTIQLVKYLTEQGYFVKR